jgi:hypothetical protein
MLVTDMVSVVILANVFVIRAGLLQYLENSVKRVVWILALIVLKGVVNVSPSVENCNACVKKDIMAEIVQILVLLLEMSHVLAMVNVILMIVVF